jgi:hypothetical protein
MKIALDYDETYTAAPVLFEAFVAMAKQLGHQVTFVTYRQDKYDNEDIHADAQSLGIDIVFTSGKQKRHVFEADIWIDDSPITIPKFEELGNMYDGCIANGDY